jgi:glycosyltransferase involved in cell wall biosynthesis
MSEKKKKTGSVCILTRDHYPDGGRCEREAQALVEDGHEVHVVCLWHEGQARQQVVRDVAVHRLAPGGSFFVKAKLRLFSLHLKHHFDVIQVDNPPDALVFATMPERIFGARVILRHLKPAPEMHEAAPGRSPSALGSWWLRASERAAISYANRTMASHREARTALGRRGGNVNRISVVVNVPDDDRLHPEHYRAHADQIVATRRQEHREGIFRIIYHGPMDRGRGLHLLVRALPRLAEDIPGARLRVMGQGGDAMGVIALAKKLGVSERVEVIGEVPFENAAEEILAADVAVVPTQKSPYATLVPPHEVFELVALKCPVVASRLPATTSYFGDDTFIYFEPGQEDDLAGKLAYAFARPEETAARVAAATKVLDTFRWERERKKYLGVYHLLLRR